MKLPIKINKSQLAAFCEKHHIDSLGLFGSVLTPNFTTTSDVDVLVEFDQRNLPTLFDLVDIETELSSLVGRRVDLKTPNDLSPYFRQEVLSHLQKLYGQ